MATQTKTFHKGASHERDVIRNKIRRMKQEVNHLESIAWANAKGWTGALVNLENWLAKRGERYGKKKGGL